MITYRQCPICNSKNISPALSAKDHTVSNETFKIMHCNDCSGRFTQDVAEQESIGRYYASENYISHSDTRKGFVNNLYHAVRKRTLQQKRRLIETFTGSRTGKVLDIGCGTGAFLNAMQSAGWTVEGLEPDENARTKALEINKVSAKQSEELFKLEPNTYDAVTMWHVLEHVHQLHQYLDQIKNVLKDNGCLFIAVPNFTSYDASIYQENWAAYDVPRHLYHFSPQSMELLVKAHGMRVSAIRPMRYDSFYVSMLSEKYRSGKSNLISAFYTGLISNLKAFGNNKKCSSVIYIIRKENQLIDNG